jgi:hypothetical protein
MKSSLSWTKLRLFAWCSDVIQGLLGPIKTGLLNTLKGIPTDCTHDQHAGALWVQDQIRQGQQVYSVDLSSATNNFPLSPQLMALTIHGVCSEWVQIIEDLSTAQFYCASFQDLPREAEFLRTFPLKWKVGQPLGLVFSFPMFALTHNALLYGICRRLNVVPEDSFRILGDDVVVSDPLVHKEYLRILESARIPVSHHKCLSGKTAEFAGAKITSDYIVHTGSYNESTARTMFSNVERFGLRYIEYEAPSNYTKHLKLWLFHCGGEYVEEDYPWLLKANSLIEEEVLPSADRFPWGPTCFSKLSEHIEGVLHDLDQRFKKFSGPVLMLTDSSFMPVYQGDETKELATRKFLSDLCQNYSVLWHESLITPLVNGFDCRDIVRRALKLILHGHETPTVVLELFDKWCRSVTSKMFASSNEDTASSKRLLRTLGDVLE